MALFKVLRGNEANLPEQLTDGYAYFTSDTNNFYIDHLDENGNLVRSLNGVGQRAPQNGEVFNDYENNLALTEHSHAEGTGTVAGKMAHLIMSIPSSNQFELESVDGLEVGYTVSYSVPFNGNITAWAEWQDMGIITAINGNIITLDTDITGITNDHIQDEYNGTPVREQRIIRRLWVNDHPEVGLYGLSRRTHAEGRQAQALGDASHAEGKSTKAIGAYSHAEGSGNKVYSNGGHAEGRGTVVEKDAEGGHSEGEYTKVVGYGGHAEGGHTEATGHFSHAEGSTTIASNSAAHAEGYKATASGEYSHAEGLETEAIGQSSHAEGSNSNATNIATHAEGYNTTASGLYAHAEGDGTVASNSSTHAEGISTTASGNAAHTEGLNTSAIEEASHAEGSGTEAGGRASHAEGSTTIASNTAAHAEGYDTTASGVYAHAEGYSSSATKDGAHSEGRQTTASGAYSHAEGYRGTASGTASHVEGGFTTAQGDYSHAGGHNSRAFGVSSFAHGKGAFAYADYSIALGTMPEYDGAKKLLLNIGNGNQGESGTEDNRSSALKLDFDGNLTIQGGITANNIYNKTEIDSKLSSVYKYKGTVATLADLPANPEVGDVYNIETGNGTVVNVRKFNITRNNGYNETLQSTILYFSNDVSDIPEDQYSATAYDKSLNELGHVYTVDINNKYIEVDGDHSASGLTECYVIFDNDAYNTDELSFGDINPGDNLAWTGDHWDELAGITDLSEYATKEEVNSKLSTVYKYKGTVNTVNNLPTSNQVGDVYNVKTSGTLTETILGYPCEVTGLFCGPMFDGTEFFGNLPGGTSGLVNVYAPNKEFIAQIDHSTIDDGVFRIPGKDYTSELSEGTYYLEFLDNPIYNYELVKSEIICTVVGGDNVAWDGTTWDVLAGTEDLSIYATKDEMNSKLSSVYRYKGTVNTVNDLPNSNRVVGDVYNVKNSNPRVIRMEYAIPTTISEIQVIDQTHWIQTFCTLTFTDSSIDLSHIFSQSESYPGFELYYNDSDDIYKTISTSVMTYTKISDNSIKCEFMTAPGYNVTNLSYVTYFQTTNEIENSEKGSALIKVDRTIAIPLTAGDNIAWTGSEWDVLAGTVDTSSFATKSTTLSGYGITDAYTKTEVDSKLSSVYNYKGTIVNPSDLPKTPNVGDVWNIKKSGTISVIDEILLAEPILINAGDNVAWTGSTWDVLAGTIDLSGYATKEEVSGLVSIREATFEEIDAALNDMAASYTAMKTLTEEIIAEQNALVGGTE